VRYAELHCHSSFSFLDGASHPEELVTEAARLGLEALALTDHEGMYGVVRFFEAAREAGVRTVFGAELALAGGRPASPRTRVEDPPDDHLLVLARDPEGYARLARAVSEAHLAGHEKLRPSHDLHRLATHAGGHFLVLTGCRKGAVPRAVVNEGPAAAARELDRLVEAFGRDNVAVELWDHGDPIDGARNDAMAELAATRALPVVATNVVHYARPGGRRIATLLAAIRSGRPLDEIDGWLPAGAGAHLRSAVEQARRFDRYPGAVELAGELGRALAFDLALVAPRLPDFPVPPGHTEASYLRALVEERAPRRYGTRDDEQAPGAWRQLDHELAMIEQLGFPGYFLVVFDIVEFCRRNDIYCQGRGSAASSAVCYVLGITNADAVRLGLLFERFLSPERDGPPDIDVDIESGRREEVIQYVYGRYGRECAALVAVAVTYRARSAIRDAGKAFGYPEGTVDRWAKGVDRWAKRVERPAAGPGEAPEAAGIPAQVLEAAIELEGYPRHLGIHPGGMVICDRPVSEVCPVEWARMENRTVLQWDKDDCATVGLVKFDLLGLGMLEVLHRTIDMIRAHHGDEIDMATIPQEPEVYDMLCRGDSVGVFQVESRAQMATLPRLQPRCFYDLVVEVALIRPGPIQGGSVHPYLRRRNGLEPVTYVHPVFERSLKKTLGVPLFQEQLMEMAIDAAGFSAGEADQLRQAMGSKRSADRMNRLRDRLFAGMAERGITGEVAAEIWEKLRAFANFGFPESHSVSFAYLVYVSAWLKLRYPAALLAGLLNSQPMGFWAPHSLVADARRHGVVVLGPEVNRSEATCSLEGAGPAVRLGISSVKEIGAALADRIASERPYEDLEDLARRTGANRAALEALSTAGAVSGLTRREALWISGAAAESTPDRLPGTAVGVVAPQLPAMTPFEEMAADLQTLGLSPAASPVALAREGLAERGAVPIASLLEVANGARVTIAGIVTHRQRPATAAGVTFINLEDETGLMNVICSTGLWVRYRRAARSAVVMLVRGRVERADGGNLEALSSANLIAEYLEALDLPDLAGARSVSSRDFR
jgi:error-prone DNA polymerase